MKKLINSPETVVTDALQGVAAAHPSLSVDVENKVIVRAGGPRPGKVGLVSGGGSGHEPLHGGFVGYGMLDAACPGEVFTSPVPDQMLAATRAVNGGAGVLHIVKNYTGDVLNFQMAAEMAGDDGIEVVPVVINDDVAVQDSLYTAGRRGTGATVFVDSCLHAGASPGPGNAQPPWSRPRIAIEFRITATHTGDIPDLPASGGAIDVEGTAFLTLSGGKVTEVRTVFDTLALAVQTGAAKAPAWWPGRS